MSGGLPIELLDMIFEETELATRKACSLVCHAWLDFSRKYLFNLVIIRHDTSFDAFHQFLAAHPHIGIHIRTIHLVGPSEDHYLCNRQQEKYPCIDPNRLVSIALSAPKVSRIQLKTVILVNSPDDVKAALLDSLHGPIALPEFIITECPHGLYHHPIAIMDLLHLLQTKTMYIQLAGGWALDVVQDAYHSSSALPRWPVCHPAICMKGFYHERPSPLSALTDLLAPGSLHMLHLAFDQWSHLEEMARFLKCFGESITEFTITFANALLYHVQHDHTRESMRTCYALDRSY